MLMLTQPVLYEYNQIPRSAKPTIPRLYLVARQPPKRPSNPLEEAAQQLGIPAWGKILIGGLALGGLAIGGALLHAELRLASMHTLMDKMSDELSDKMDVKLAALRSDFDNKLANLQVDLMKQFFSRAKQLVSAGNMKDAAAAIRAATILAKISTQSHTPANDSFFRSAIQSLDEMEQHVIGPSVLITSSYHAKIALAEYRSGLEPPPQRSRIIWTGPVGGWVVSPLEPNQIHSPPTFLYGGIVLDCSKNTCSFRLDGWKLKDVTLMGANVLYEGGPVVLDNVHFVNCSFMFPVFQTPSASKLATYIALGVPLASIG
jgi:hypothetical protein